MCVGTIHQSIGAHRDNNPSQPYPSPSEWFQKGDPHGDGLVAKAPSPLGTRPEKGVTVHYPSEAYRRQETTLLFADSVGDTLLGQPPVKVNRPRSDWASPDTTRQLTT
jgi:hypothetical protein